HKMPPATFSIAIAFAVWGLLFNWAWFPLLNGIYRDIGFQSDSETLTLWTYVLGSLTFGFFSAIQKSRAATPTTFPSTVAVPAQPSSRTSFPPPARRQSFRYAPSTGVQSGSVVVASKARQ